MAKRYVFLVRHGERIDKVPTELYTYKGKVNMLDPILTETGVAQAKETGKFLDGHLSKIEAQANRAFDRVYIYTSPFIRCVQTAANIASEFEDEDQINVDYGFGEFLGEYLYDEDPMLKLEVKNNSAKQLNDAY